MDECMKILDGNIANIRKGIDNMNNLRFMSGSRVFDPTAGRILYYTQCLRELLPICKEDIETIRAAELKLAQDRMPSEDSVVVRVRPWNVMMFNGDGSTWMMRTI